MTRTDRACSRSPWAPGTSADSRNSNTAFSLCQRPVIFRGNGVSLTHPPRRRPGPTFRCPSPATVRGQAVDESACKPGSVHCPKAAGDHPSRAYVAAGLMRSTRKLGRAALERFLSDLAPGGVYLAGRVTPAAGGLLHHRFTLTVRRTGRRSVFCGTVPRVTPGGRYPPPCPVEPGLSSARPEGLDAVARPARPP